MREERCFILTGRPTRASDSEFSQEWERTYSFAVYGLAELKKGRLSLLEGGESSIEIATLSPSSSLNDVEACLKGSLPQLSEKLHLKLSELKLPFDHTYPRIARPSIGRDVFEELGVRVMSTSWGKYYNEEEGFSSLGDFRLTLDLIISRLSKISRTIFPHRDNLVAFGHEIRELHVMACMEAEALWKMVMQSNGYPKDRCTTHDYQKLCTPMRLHEYEIRFRLYDQLPSFTPFAKWNQESKPSESLPWYAAYQHSKHDRARHFQKSNLKHLFEAVAACVAMGEAQFGYLLGLNSATLRENFYFVKVPNWEPEEFYVTPYRGFSETALLFS